MFSERSNRVAQNAALTDTIPHGLGDPKFVLAVVDGTGGEVGIQYRYNTAWSHIHVPDILAASRAARFPWRINYPHRLRAGDWDPLHILAGQNLNSMLSPAGRTVAIIGLTVYTTSTLTRGACNAQSSAVIPSPPGGPAWARHIPGRDVVEAQKVNFTIVPFFAVDTKGIEHLLIKEDLCGTR